MVEPTFFQGHERYVAQHTALQTWARNNRPFEYQFEEREYVVLINQTDRHDQISLVVKWSLNTHNAEVAKRTYSKGNHPFRCRSNDHELPKWSQIINEGESIDRPQIRFHTPDQTRYKTEAILFIAFACLALYGAKKARDRFLPNKPVKPRTKYR